MASPSRIAVLPRGAARALLVARSLCATVLIGISAPGCQESAPVASEVAAPTNVDVAGVLPPFDLRPDTKKALYLTYVEDDGDFQIVEKLDDVPAPLREAVRVVEAGKEEGTGGYVYVADLRQVTANGSYGVVVMPRSQWEQRGADKRQVRMEQMAPVASAEPALGPSGPDPKNASVRAVIYGADWCKPCHLAEDYLRSLGVNVTKKDIDKSDAARAEMQTKLAKINKLGAGIPVIDVAGQLLLGFNQQALDRAVQIARGTHPG